MTALQGAVESAAPVSRLHEHQSFTPDDFPVPTGREEEWRFTPLRSSAKGPHPASGGWAPRHPPGGSPCVCASSGPCTGPQPQGSGG
jgi:hypothetical protein